MTGVLIKLQVFTNSDIHTGEGNMRYVHTIQYNTKSQGTCTQVQMGLLIYKSTTSYVCM